MKPRIHIDPKNLHIRCSKQELQAWRKTAKTYKLKLSEWVRGILNSNTKP